MRGEYKLHRHDRDELFLVMEGHLTIEVDGRVHELDPGMAITISKGSAHRSRSEMMTLAAVFEPQGINIEFL
jgi:mannose-6-phosphate isomerase-like protein (cupin superfamily)